MVRKLDDGVKGARERPPMRVVLAGAGIGGLTAALALDPAVEVEVLEQAEALSAIGAGLQLGPNATRILARLGLGEALAGIGFEPEANELRDAASGALMLRQPLREAARERWGAPYLHVHRADLQALLAQAVAGRPGATVRLGARVEGLEQDGADVRVRLGGGEVVEADALIGCDGLRSGVRQALWGAESPRFTGMTAWRGAVETAALPAGLIAPVTTVWTGRGRHFVHYYVRGGALVNFVGVVERADGLGESWTEPGDGADLARDFAGWPTPVQALIEAVPQAWRWALFDRPPLARWSKGRASLLGDAAHPMLPSFAQGASQAIEDAEALGRRLCDPATAEAALVAYESERRGRTARVQALSRRNARLFHLGPPARALFAAEAALAWLGASKGAGRFDWLYGYGRG
jgi:salicylate hydroxylase